MSSRILVIKFAALGDVVQAIGPMRRIRAAHPEAEITLLTTPPYSPLVETLGVFDRIWTDGRPKRLRDTLAMVARLRRARFDRVYDLQTSSRSSFLHKALWPRIPEWSGIALGASHPDRNPDRTRVHTLERQASQLKDAGIWPDAPTAPGTAPAPDLSFLVNDPRPERSPAYFGLSEPYALLVPGASARRPGKRWPAARYGELAARLQGQGLQVAVIGGALEREAAAVIAAAAHGAVDLTTKTDFAQIAALGVRAALAVGNDTGPSHLIAAAGAPMLVLFSSESQPELCAPRGARTAILQVARLADLETDRVSEALYEYGLLPGAKS